MQLHRTNKLRSHLLHELISLISLYEQGLQIPSFLLKAKTFSEIRKRLNSLLIAEIVL